jgi:hypothetical protein
MNHQPDSSTDRIVTSLLFRSGLALLVLLGLLITAANAQDQRETQMAGSSMHVKHVLGFERTRRNAGGDLLIQDDRVRFERDQSPAAEITISSIRNISLGTEDKQVGGVPMMLGKAAVPFGGGRVVSLFSHKKYDSMTIEYLDSGGGFHGAIFQLPRGRGLTFKNDLIAHGANIVTLQDPIPVENASQESPKADQQWSVEVDRIDPGATTLDPCFADAVYESLLEELSRSKQFKHVFRSGDRNANDIHEVLVLKTIVEKYSPGSETRRAVTTVTGATKLNVRIQLLARNGAVVLDRTIQGNVRFFGDNLRATHNVAHNAANTLKRSTISGPASETQMLMSNSSFAPEKLLATISDRIAPSASTGDLDIRKCSSRTSPFLMSARTRGAATFVPVKDSN